MNKMNSENGPEKFILPDGVLIAVQRKISESKVLCKHNSKQYCNELRNAPF